jgi:hypothetical protein
MGSRNPATWAKREREQAVKERRDRKREKKSAAAAAKLAAAEGGAPPEAGDLEANGADGNHAESSDAQ